jgi:hypothetical protein
VRVMFQRIILNIFLSVIIGFVPSGSASSTAEMLEKAIYEEETVGNLDAAMEIYTDIAADADADRPFVAQALYRLGQCQLKSGQEERAEATFRKLVNLYSDQADWVAKARAHLPGPGPEEGPSAAGLPVGPAPWSDGELLRFVVKLPDGRSIGDLTYSARSVTAAGRSAWRIETFMALPKAELAKYVYVDADRDTFAPLSTHFYHSQLGTLRADYVAGERRIMMNRPGGTPEPFSHRLPGVTFDNEQILHLLRRLPLKLGFETTFPATGRPGVTATAAVAVKAIENVTVPAGVFECFRMEVGTPPYIETQFISTDANRYIVKVLNPEITVELTEITRLPEGPSVFQEPKTGISLRVPAGWDIQNSSFRFAEHEYFLVLFAPGMKVKAAGVAQKLEPRVPVREFAEMDLEIYKGRRDSFHVVENSWNETEIAGAPAVSVLATLRSENEDVREYRIYIDGPSAYYWFIYRANPETFDSMKGEFDSIVESLAFR